MTLVIVAAVILALVGWYVSPAADPGSSRLTEASTPALMVRVTTLTL